MKKFNKNNLLIINVTEREKILRKNFVETSLNTFIFDVERLEKSDYVAKKILRCLRCTKTKQNKRKIILQINNDDQRRRIQQAL